MNTTTQTPEARREAFICQIEGTREAVENFCRTNWAAQNEYREARYEAYETAVKLADLRNAALAADFTMLQEMKAHKDITRLVRQAEKLQAEVERFQASLKAVEEKIYAKY